ncbi:MAG: hypothetical protein GX871_00375 [Microbacteriaceae bacterium]|jgi:hypothetical protein|nr:hypothetical protein [Microbacteriaceae bacterium]HPZ35356.1 hypothetical protein [Microbacteriaceae bacterium]HQC93898.1 hypothetical protein [Microbacteriaceae bacterium]
MSYFPDMQIATLAEIEPAVYGLISKRSAVLEGVEATEVTFHVGSKWSQDLKSYAGTELCELPHVAYVTAGTLGVEMRDGTYLEFHAGDAMLLPPGHDAWAVGDTDCRFVEFSRGNDYYAQ